MTQKRLKQDLVTTMQKTGWTNNTSFLVLLYGVEKGFVLDVITRGQSTTTFLCIGTFLAWWWTNKQTNKQTTNQVILVQACSWPVRGQSFAIKLRTPFSVTYLHNMLSGQCPDVLDGCTWLMQKVARGEWCEYQARKCQQQHICTKYSWHQK